MNNGEKLKYQKGLVWQNAGGLPSRTYCCSFCGDKISSNHGYTAAYPGVRGTINIYVCHVCNSPTFFDLLGLQVPNSKFGDEVKDIADPMVSSLYEEARGCCQANAYTAAVLACRKILMHIAVDKGAAQNLSFAKYVEHLEQKNLFPPDAKEWVDHIRTTGNDANHEIKLMTKEDAEHLIDFVGMLLKMIYEFPAAAKRRVPPKPATP